MPGFHCNLIGHWNSDPCQVGEILKFCFFAGALQLSYRATSSQWGILTLDGMDVVLGVEQYSKKICLSRHCKFPNEVLREGQKAECFLALPSTKFMTCDVDIGMPYCFDFMIVFLYNVLGIAILLENCTWNPRHQSVQ